MKLFVIQTFSRSLPARSTYGFLPYSHQNCQKFARNHPQGYQRNFHSAIHRTDHSQSPHFARKAQLTASRVTLDGNIATMWAGLPGDRTA
jgi:hypothetical protein